MMFLKSIIALAVSQAVLASADPTVVNDNEVEILPGYKTVVPTISGELFGEKYELNGTVDSVYSQLAIKYAGQDIIDGWGVNVNSTEAVEKRKSKQGILCLPVSGQSWEKAWSDATLNAANILKGYGRITIGARSCGRVTCAGGFDWTQRSSIYICNDNYYNIDPAMAYIATYVQDINYRCVGPITKQGPPRYLTGGQMFDSDGYNVIVQKTNNCN